MNALLRATAILADPSAAWARIEKESGDTTYVLGSYVALLALVPALCGFIGAALIGADVAGGGPIRASIFDAVFGAIFAYAAAFGEVLLVGLLIELLALRFGGLRSMSAAFKLTVYSFTPLWLAGIFLLLPGTRFLTLVGFYGAYLLWTGLPPLMKVPEQRSLPYAAAVIVFATFVAFLAAVAQRALFGSPGI